MIVQEALDAADRGSFGLAVAALAQSEAGSAEHLLLRSTLAVAGTSGVEAPSVHALAGLPASAALLRAVEDRFRLALARFDADARASLLPIATRAAVTLGEAGRARLECLNLWQRVADGHDARDDAQALRKQAARLRLPSVVVEAEVIGVYSATRAGALDEALRLARTASRMASAERLLLVELLAHLALAHVRRALGKPHLASLILEGLRRSAPSPWWPWIDWERGLAGAPLPALDETFAAARSADRARFTAAGAALREATRGFAPAAHDALALLEALDPAREPTVARAFVHGPPTGAEATNTGFLFADPGDASGTLAYVSASPNGARRLLAAGRGLCGDVPTIEAGTGQSRRAMAFLCELALGGPSTLPTVFERVYGFRYVPGRHAGAFRVMLHRARALGEGRLEVIRDEDTLRLEVKTPCLLPDPRARLELDERVLSVLGHRAATAAEVAAELGVSSRAVQKVLRRLLDEGVCEGETDGRGRRYRVLDTTFTEPSYVVPLDIHIDADIDA